MNRLICTAVVALTLQCFPTVALAQTNGPLTAAGGMDCGSLGFQGDQF